MKTCNICKQEKDLSCFSKHPECKDGVRPRCNECLKEYTEKNKDKVRNNYLMREFGITSEQYDEMNNKQNGVCAICNKPETAVNNKTGETKRLAVDHNHSTGIVRKLLCTNCNTGIGSLQESIETLRNAIQYLKKPLSIKEFSKLVKFCRSHGILNYKDENVEFTLSPSDPKEEKKAVKKIKTVEKTVEERLAEMTDEDLLLYSAASFSDKEL